MRMPIVSRQVVRAGLAGDVPDTPKPGHAALARAQARVIGSRIDAMEGARVAAVERGYQTIVLRDPVVGEARDAGPAMAGAVSPGRRAIGATRLRDLERRDDGARDRHGIGRPQSRIRALDCR